MSDPVTPWMSVTTTTNLGFFDVSDVITWVDLSLGYVRLVCWEILGKRLCS